MYAFSLTTCRIGRQLSNVQICTISKLAYRELTNDSSKVTSTLFQKVIHEDNTEQKRKFSLENAWSEGSKQLNLQMQVILGKSKEILQTVKMTDLADAPRPSFWYGVCSLAPLALPTVTCFLFGYSPFLAKAQLLFGATFCAFNGGIKWGHTTVKGSPQEPSWENLGYAVVPAVVAWTGLLLPQTLGFFFVAGGLLSSAYIDLTSPFYPPWLKASRLILTVPAVLLLFIMWFVGLFH